MKKCYAISHVCNPSLRVFNVFIMVATVKASYDFPTYTHPVYTNQLCYKCPPGYKKINDCPPGNDASIPAWPTCAKCGTNEYMDDWNINPRCKSQIKCGDNHLPCGKTSTFSKAECTCHSSSIENERGDCVKGVAKSEYDQDLDVKDEEIKQCRQTLSNLQSSFAKATPRTPEMTTPFSPVTQPRSDTNKVPIASVLLSVCLLISVFVNVYQCYKYHKTGTNKSNEASRDESLSGDVELAKAERQKTEMMELDRRNRPPVVRAIQQQNSATSEDRDPLLQRDDSTDNEEAFPGNQTAANYLDKAFLILEKSVRSSKDDLDELMRDVFGFDFILCEDIKKTPDDVTSNLRQAFSTWIKKQSDDATPETLVRALGEHQWNAEADKIAKHYNVSPVKVETDDAEMELNIGIKMCEKMITTRVPAFVRNCLGIENIDTTNKSSADVIRKAFRLWRRKYSSKATVLFLIQQLLSNHLTHVAQQICEELEKRNIDGSNSGSHETDDTAASHLHEEVDVDFDDVSETMEGSEHQWNDIVDNVAKIYSIFHNEVETDDASSELDIAIKVCERTITSNVPDFIRNCLGIEDIDTTNKLHPYFIKKAAANVNLLNYFTPELRQKKSVDVIREAFKKWKDKYSLKTALFDLIQQLVENDYKSTAKQIHEEMVNRLKARKSHREDAAGDQLNEKAFSSNITEGPAKKDEAQPIYPPGSQPPDEPVRELTQATADMTPSSDISASYSATKSEEPPAENNDPRTVPKVPYGFDGRPVTYDDCDDDPAVLKVDDENYGREIEEIDVVDEHAAGGGKSANQTQEEQP